MYLRVGFGLCYCLLVLLVRGFGCVIGCRVCGCLFSLCGFDCCSDSVLCMIGA